MNRKLRKRLDLAEIERVIAKIRPGDEFEIQFNQESVGDVNYLLGMHSNGFLTVDEGDVTLMYAVAFSQSWDHPINRIFLLKANQNWNYSWFSGKLSRRLESVVIIE